jgi:hypothetical protein
LMRMTPQNPECYTGLLALTALAVAAALAKWPAPVRVGAQLAWLALYVIGNRYVLYEF